MTDARFFQNAGPFSLTQIAEVTGCRMQLKDGDAASFTEGNREFFDVSSLDNATARDISFIDNPKYLDSFSNSKAGACFTHPKNINRAPSDIVLLVSEEPYAAFAKAASLFYPAGQPEAGIASSAQIHEDAVIGEACTIEHGAVIEAGVKIGNNSYIGANVVISRNVEIGTHCYIGPNATISHALIGNHVTLHAGVHIGQDGFGFAPSREGIIKVPQLGRVIVEDHVDIGAGSCIDRGSGTDTVIGAHTKIDNLVQIAHNVRIGRYCFLAAQVGIAGSAVIEDQVMMGGQSGVAGHITLGKGAKLAAKAGLMTDQPAGTTYMGMPAVPSKQFFRQITWLKQVATERGKKDD